jgi:tRNA1Val (adenine37-N6)-methyltransferase
MQHKSAMKVSSDSVLLGGWADCCEKKTILDIGTGTGLIALMTAQRSKADVHAIEIDPLAYNEAFINAFNSPWRERITVEHISLQQFIVKTNQKFDFIISNPPYYKNSYKSEKKERNTARNTESLPYTILIEGVSKLLTPNGSFSVILPCEAGQELIEIAFLKDLFCQRKCFVKLNKLKPNYRVMIEFGFEYSKTHESTLCIENENHKGFTDQYKKLLKDFYLKF